MSRVGTALAGEAAGTQAICEVPDQRQQRGRRRQRPAPQNPRAWPNADPAQAEDERPRIDAVARGLATGAPLWRNRPKERQGQVQIVWVGRPLAVT
jgi:hypothetical protein